MNRFLILIVSFAFSVVCVQCTPENHQNQIDLENPVIFHRAQKKLTDVIVYDIFSPPVASRIYAYANLAAYEAMVPNYPEYQSLQNRLNQFDQVTQPDTSLQYNFNVSGIHAFLKVGKQMIFSEASIEEFHQSLLDSIKPFVDSRIFENSLAFGDKIAEDILKYAAEDNYNQTRGFRYTIMEEDGKWMPTPPAYMDAIEPFWNQIRPFVLDSANQFVPLPPHPFNLDHDSDFHRQVMEVYQTGNQLSEEQIAIASFWDCNPFVMHTMGHAMYATKKITPGGHWIGITAIATRNSGADLMQTVEAYTLVSITLADAFISCWDEKYRSNLIRPETVINEYIDSEWKPILQTPPFPEYTSGHSVISTAAAVTLTSLFGDNFSFIDSTEVEFGLPPRNFDSFYHASEEAAISRLYGGIHYMMAIKNGVEQGKEVGKFINNNLVLRQNQVALNKK
ncbi:MAG: vanadium-dependent haloperoxidase [Candidatus Cyclobacteriaceae bacterium M3_2C_046]